MPAFQTVAAIAPLVIGLVGAALLAQRSVSRNAAVITAALLVVTSGIWSQVQKEYEGPTVVPFTGSRGLTIADLVLVPSLAIAVALVARARRR